MWCLCLWLHAVTVLVCRFLVQPFCSVFLLLVLCYRWRLGKQKAIVCCKWIWVMRRVVVTGQSSAWATEGGMWSCFNLCQCSSVGRWWKFRAQCVALHYVIDPAAPSCERHSKALAFYSTCVYECVYVCARPYQCRGRPLSPYQSGPPGGEIGRAAPSLHCCSVQTQKCTRLSLRHCLCGVSPGVALKDLLCCFPSP